MSTESKKKPSFFAIVTVLLGVIAISLIVWRISKAWRLVYGDGPREVIPIPTGGSYGAPGIVAELPTRGSTASAPPTSAPTATAQPTTSASAQPTTSASATAITP